MQRFSLTQPHAVSACARVGFTLVQHGRYGIKTEGEVEPRSFNTFRWWGNWPTMPFTFWALLLYVSMPIFYHLNSGASECFVYVCRTQSILWVEWRSLKWMYIWWVMNVYLHGVFLQSVSWIIVHFTCSGLAIVIKQPRFTLVGWWWWWWCFVCCQIKHNKWHFTCGACLALEYVECTKY
jgi:hypothetical protein